MPAAPRFFKSPAAFRTWLGKNHATAREIVVGFHRVHTGRPSLTWPQSVAEALCFGWIDGIRRTIDEGSYSIRFTPRRRGSRWSAVNIRTVAELEAAGKMTPAGRAAFEARPNRDAAGYTYERQEARFDAARLGAFKKHKAAWKFFNAQPPGYRKKLTWWIMSARQDATRDRRLAQLVENCSAGRRMF